MSGATTRSVSAADLTERQHVQDKNPWIRLAGDYYPKHIKDAFKKSYLCYSRNELIRKAINKMAEYPITPIEYHVEEGNEQDQKEESDIDELKPRATEDIYRHIFEKSIGINERMIEIGLDYHLYANVIPTLVLPFTRYFECPKCTEKVMQEAKDGEVPEIPKYESEQVTKLKWSGKKFKGTCPGCLAEDVEFATTEEPARDNYDDVNLIRRNIYRIRIDVAEMTGRRRYIYNVSNQTRTKIMKNDRFTLDNTPMIALEQSSKPGSAIILNSDEMYHFRMPMPTTINDEPWSLPLLVSAFNTIFYIMNLRKAVESIGNQHIDPSPYIAPAVNLDTLVGNFDMDDITKRLEEAYRKSREDENHMTLLPFPIKTGMLNLQGRALMPNAEIQSAFADLFIAIGIPRGVLTGEGPYNTNSLVVRVLENAWLTYRDNIHRLLDFIAGKIAGHFKLDHCQVRMTRLIKLDDATYKRELGTAAEGKKISDEAYVTALGLDYHEQMEKVRRETLAGAKLQAEAEEILETKRIEIMEKAEIDRMSSMAEKSINEMKNIEEQIISMVRTLVNKGYSKKYAMGYVSEFMARQRAEAEAAAADARRREAESAFLMERRENATHGLNRAQDRQQFHSMMDTALQDPALNIIPHENETISQIVNRLVNLPDNDMNAELDTLSQRNPVLWQQVINIIGNHGKGQNAQG